MTTVFKTTLMPVLTVMKCMGLINVCYTMDPTGSFVQYKNTMYFQFLELARMSALVVCTYTLYQQDIYVSQKFDMLKFWVAVIAARISEIWIIK